MLERRHAAVTGTPPVLRTNSELDGLPSTGIVTRMQTMKPDITAANVRIDYSGSGLGFAGDPNGMEIAPLVTVRLTGMQFVPLTGFMFATLNMPGFSTTMPAEDFSRNSIELG